MKMKYIVVILMFFMVYTTSWSQQLAFPSAEGYGKYTTGGRGGTVYEVTTLNPTGTGSLGAAISASGPRTVVFKVAGTITGSFNITNGNITIAGQTAPGDGICIRGNLSTSADNIIIRYIRVRWDPSMGESDAIGGRFQKNIIFDHVTASWSTDETMSLYHNDSTTVQWCLISEACEKFVDGVGIGHRFGGIWGNNYGTWHHNLIANNDSRNPRWASGVGYNDYRNNVLYNWGYQGAYGGEAVQPGAETQFSFSTINIIANYYKSGPATGPKSLIVYPSQRADNDKGSWYVSDNYVNGYPDVTADNWKGVNGSSYIKMSAPWNAMPINQQTAEDAYDTVLAHAGCSFPNRDSVDVRIVKDARNGTYTYGNNGIITDPSDVGGFPTLATGTPYTDSDHDGMSDEWEDNNGLNKNDPSDRNGIGEGGYTNLEVFLFKLDGEGGAVTGVSLSPAADTLGIASTLQINTRIEPYGAINQNVSWSSSDTSIAKVSSTGLVTGVAEGTATITVTTEDGGFTAQSTVTVVHVTVTGVTVSPSSTVIGVGDTTQLTAVVQPSNAENKTVTWSTSDSSVATVSSSGLVTGVSEGAAVITVATQDGDYKATANISVSAVDRKKCMFIVGGDSSPSSLSAGDQVINDTLKAWGYDVRPAASSDLQTLSSSDYANYDFAVASESPSSGDFGKGIFPSVPIPLVIFEGWAVKPSAMHWQTDQVVNNYNPEPVKIVDQTNSPLATGFSNGYTVTLCDSGLIIGSVPQIPIVPIANMTSIDSMRVIYGIEKGTINAVGDTIKNRVEVIGLHELSYISLTSDAFKFIKAGINWVSALSVSASISTSSVVSITRTTAVCGSIVKTGDVTMTGRGVVYNATGNPTISDSAAASYKVTPAVEYEPSYMTGLQPNTKYYVRAYATNISGTSYGNEITFTTSAGNAEAAWPLISDLTSSTVGNISASDFDTTHCPYNIAGYNQGPNNSFSWDGDGWLKVPKNSQMTDVFNGNFYLQFTVSPASGQKLTIDGISFGALGYKTGSAKIAAYYSLNAFATDSSALGTATLADSVHSTIDATADNPISLLSANTSITTPMGREYISYSPNMTVKDGETLTVRLYVWGKNGGTVGIKNPVVTGTTSSVTSVEDTQIPKSFSVSQNYPNPFNPTTEIQYAIPQAAIVTIKIYNMLGQEVKTLVSGEKAAGTYSVQWNGDNDFGAKVSSGAYIYRITAGNNIETKKMIMMK